jgi:hypothetical protein
MTGHEFIFDGGEYLTKIGASWFVSYLYYCNIDKSHMNWERIKTVKYRISIFNKTKKYHKDWLQQILPMNEHKLETNKIGLDALTIKRMAEELIGHANMTGTRIQ